MEKPPLVSRYFKIEIKENDTPEVIEQKNGIRKILELDQDGLDTKAIWRETGLPQGWINYVLVMEKFAVVMS